MSKLSRELIAEMHAFYQACRSLRKTAEHYHRAIPTVHNLFVRHGLDVNKRPFKPISKESVAAMYADYLALGSLEKVGEKWGRTRQSMFDIFKRRKLKLNEKTFLPFVEYKGQKFTAQKTCGKHRYLRLTNKRNNKTVYLHHLIWEENKGPIPAGYKVCFKDGNHLNCAIDNLELLTWSDQPRKHATGANQFTKTAEARLNLLLEGKGSVASKLRRAA